MNITTENIDEWCFRYLEKDLTSNEILFFEKELLVNSDLSVELKKWKKTYLTNEEILHNVDNVEHLLYRFKHQIALLLAESVFVIGICAGLFVYFNKETTPTTIINKPCAIIESKQHNVHSINKKEKILIVNNASIQIYAKKPLKVDTSIIEPLLLPIKSVDSITPLDTFVSDKTLENNLDSETIKDSSMIVKKPKTVTKKSNTKRKSRNGSRLIPINNDL